jgi:hypothetical protein
VSRVARDQGQGRRGGRSARGRGGGGFRIWSAGVGGVVCAACLPW